MASKAELRCDPFGQIGTAPLAPAPYLAAKRMLDVVVSIALLALPSTHVGNLCSYTDRFRRAGCLLSAPGAWRMDCELGQTSSGAHLCVSQVSDNAPECR